MPDALACWYLVIGKQDVSATLLPGKPTGSLSETEVFQHLPSRVDYPDSGVRTQHQFGMVRDYRHTRIQTPNHIVVVAAVVCIVALLLPTQGDEDSRFPSYLYLTSHLKLIFAYVLDAVLIIITMGQHSPTQGTRSRKVNTRHKLNHRPLLSEDTPNRLNATPEPAHCEARTRVQPAEERKKSSVSGHA
uniref:Uncharacterized protein n=1 Tax=Timema poppense TaxID=170557 RepID=A0A7R9DIH4_TIMPO|nr:unnamed protein product [Timema poppensis]